jgi:hypothetical protein
VRGDVPGEDRGLAGHRVAARPVVAEPHDGLLGAAHAAAPGLATRERNHHVVLAQRVPLVLDPVVDLELDPGGREQVERAGRDELLAVEQLPAHVDGVRLLELVGAVDGPQVAPEGGADGAHLRIGQVVVGAVVGATGPRGLGDLGRRRSRRGRRLPELGVEEVPGAQHLAERVEVEQAQVRGEAVPFDETVEAREELSGDEARHLVSQRHLGEPARALAVRRARVVGHLARPVEIAEGTKGVGGVPGVERHLLDVPLRAAVGGGADVLPGNGERRDADGRRGRLGPFDGGVLDRGRRRVPVALQA